MCSFTLQKLDDLTRFVYQASYDSTQSTPRQFPIDHDVIQLYHFTHFFSESTKLAPCQFLDDHEVMQSLSSVWNYIRK